MLADRVEKERVKTSISKPRRLTRSFFPFKSAPRHMHSSSDIIRETTHSGGSDIIRERTEADMDDEFGLGFKGYDKHEVSRLLDERDRNHRSELDARDERHREEKRELETKLMEEIENLKDGIVKMNDDVAPSELFGATKAEEKEGEEGTEGSSAHIDLPLLPGDTFSLLAFAKFTTTSMLVAFIVLFVQSAALILLGNDLLSGGSPENWIGVPAHVSPNTSVIQVLALFIGVFGQTDFQDSLNGLMIGYNKREMVFHFTERITRCRWILSHVTRIIVSLIGLLVTFCLIVSESDATQLLLDFTAIEFITNLDNIFFWLAAWGYLGFRAQQDATMVVTAQECSISVLKQEKGDNADGNSTKQKKVLNIIPSKMDYNREISFKARPSMAGSGVFLREDSVRKIKQARDYRLLFLVLIFSFHFAIWAFIYYRQATGAYLCQTIFVQFHDEIAPEMATFSGLYNFKSLNPWKRGQYIEDTKLENGAARFGYCDEMKAWVFSYGDNSIESFENYELPPICDWKVKSTEIDRWSEESYDIMKAANDKWFIKNNRNVTVPMSGITMKCMDCSTDTEDICGEEDKRGKCSSNNKCECEDGWRGLSCEFREPCTTLQIDDLFPPYESTQLWPKKFKILREEFNNTSSAIVEVYNRPVYTSNDTTPGIIFYNGRRWAITKPTDIQIRNSSGQKDLANLDDQKNLTKLAKYFANSFHGYWSEYNVSFLSEHVDADSPEDLNIPVGINWFESALKQKEKEVQGINKNAPVGAKLLCSTCNNETNPCKYKGICKAGECVCDSSGSSGALCQIPPLGNGLCDTFFNTPQFNYDDGDCCEETCKSTEEHTCGKATTVKDTTSYSGSSYIGYDNCEDPAYAFQTEGSKTLFRIIQRGHVICGMYQSYVPGYDDFCKKQCQAIAAAVLGEAAKVEMLVWDDNRWNELKGGKYDVVFGSDYTAGRDIFESSSRSAFSFITLPYMYAGLTFAGKAPFGSCADRLEYKEVACQDLMICVEGGTTLSQFVENEFPKDKIFELSKVGVKGVDAFNDGRCNVMADYAPELSYQNIKRAGYEGSEEDYQIGSRQYTKSFETWVTNVDDPVWTRFLTWVMNALVQAEEANVTKSTADERMATTEVFGVDFRNMFRNAVKAVGNYGDLWADFGFARAGLNKVNDGTSGIMLSMELGNYDNLGPDPDPQGRLQKVRDRGVLRCAVQPRSGFALFNGTWTGLEVDLCKGIAAAIFGQTPENESPKIEVLNADFFGSFSALEKVANPDLFFGFTRTIEREVKNSKAGGKAFDFSLPYFHDGMVFSGPLPYGQCAEQLNFTEGECVNTKVCVVIESTWEEVVRHRVPSANIFSVEKLSEAFKRHQEGRCNVIAGEQSYITEQNLLNEGYNFDDDHVYHFGTIKHSKEPLCIMGGSSDPQFSDFVKWVTMIFIHAEEEGISDSPKMPETNLFGEGLKRMWKDAIGEVGNYGNMFERNLGGIIVREGLNQLNYVRNPGPQLYSTPGTLKE